MTVDIPDVLYLGGLVVQQAWSSLQNAMFPVGISLLSIFIGYLILDWLSDWILNVMFNARSDNDDIWDDEMSAFEDYGESDIDVDMISDYGDNPGFGHTYDLNRYKEEDEDL